MVVDKARWNPPSPMGIHLRVSKDLSPLVVSGLDIVNFNMVVLVLTRCQHENPVRLMLTKHAKGYYPNRFT